MDKKVVVELIQEKCKARRIRRELSKLLQPQYRKSLFKKYDVLEAKLGGIGASAKTARLIVESIKPIAL